MQRQAVERLAQQRVHRHRAGDGGGGAPTLAARERQPLPDREPDAPAARGSLAGAPQHRRAPRAPEVCRSASRGSSG